MQTHAALFSSVLFRSLYKMYKSEHHPGIPVTIRKIPENITKKLTLIVRLVLNRGSGARV